MLPLKNSLEIIFEDEYLMVLNKPPGISVTSSETEKEDTLEDILSKNYGIDVERSGIVHRLDKDTSGLLLVAKTPEILAALQDQFKTRAVKKEYLCLVHGFLKKGGIVEGAIARNPLNREKFMVVDEGKTALTQYEPIKYYEMSDLTIQNIFEGFNKIQFRKLYSLKYSEFTLVSCKPQTGRTHQIRIHLKYIGFPIVGDSKYGGRKISRLDKRFCPRQFLHAAKLEFFHPKLKKYLTFEISLPEDLLSSLKKLDQINLNHGE